MVGPYLVGQLAGSVVADPDGYPAVRGKPDILYGKVRPEKRRNRANRTGTHWTNWAGTYRTNWTGTYRTNWTGTGNGIAGKILRK